MNRYEIRVVGHLETRRAHALGAEGCRLLPDGLSALAFAAVDRAATYGLLSRLRDAGLDLVSVVRISAGEPDSEAADEPGSREADGDLEKPMRVEGRRERVED